MQPSREIFLEGRLVHITLSDFGSICSIAGFILALFVAFDSVNRK